MKRSPLVIRLSLFVVSLALMSALIVAANARPREEPTDPETGLTQREALGEGSADGQEGDTDFGDPLPDADSGRFFAGREAFEEVEGIADGIGPVFNNVSCASCHNGPAIGGGSDVLSTRIGAMGRGGFDSLERFGGPTIQTQGIGEFGDYEFVGEVVPKEASIVARRRATPLFGFGLVDAVPDSTLIFIAWMQNRHSPETAGRPNVVVNLRTGDPAVGRFGWKAQAATVFDFCADAYKDEMGITVPGLHDSDDGRNVADENCPQGDCDALEWNPIPSPNEGDADDVEAFADFIRLLAPPPRGRITRAVRAGASVFRKTGCSACHLPTLRTQDGVAFHPYSDFLLHNMGRLGDGIEQGTASGREMRTAPLWGLREQPFFLHDGRADTVEEAILLHDGQAGGAVHRFLHLNHRDRQNLMEFLASL
jgi:CxxC motif-containing protein (DUF1111 family)